MPTADQRQSRDIPGIVQCTLAHVLYYNSSNCRYCI